MKISRIWSLVSPLVSAPRTCSFNSCGRLRIEIIARLSIERSLRERPGRPQPAPQQYSVTNSWNGLLKSSADFIEFSTYSLPNTSLRIFSPVSYVCWSMVGSSLGFWREFLMGDYPGAAWLARYRERVNGDAELKVIGDWFT